MYGIAIIDVPAKSARYVRAALPHAPVVRDEPRRAMRVVRRAIQR